MNPTTKRHIAAWVLLAVYLPMLLISSLHVHEIAEYGEATCAECVHHQCHGHLSQLSDGMHQCVLCQILTLSYLSAGIGAWLCYRSARKATYLLPCQELCQRDAGFVCLRAPPAV